MFSADPFSLHLPATISPRRGSSNDSKHCQSLPSSLASKSVQQPLNSQLSPLLNSPHSLQETLNGVSTIRAYRQASRFIVENRARVDCNTGVYFASINTNRWLAVRMEFIGAVIVLATAALAVYSLGLPNGIEPGLIGLMITYGA